MSRILKKYSHKYEFLKLELEDFQEEFQDFESEWIKLFGEYFSNIKTEYWVNEETGEVRKDPPEKETPKVEKARKVKRLYRRASTKAHPDRGGNIDDFNYIKSCYDNNDLLGLLSYASQNGIEFDVNDNDKEILEQNCMRLQTKINNLRKSLIWSFFKGNDITKNGVIKQLELEHNIKIDKKKILNQLES